MTPRAVRVQLLAGFLVCLGVLTATLPAYSQRKNENNPDKIGHRTVARRSIISPEKERALGKQMAEQFEKSAKLIQDPVVEQYVSTVAGNVASHSDWKGQITIKVVKAPEAESYSLPGGFIYINSGLLLAAENDDEIAGAIAHQVAHAAARHWAGEYTKVAIFQLSIAPLMNIPTNTTAQSQVLHPAVVTAVCAGDTDYGSMGMPRALLNFQHQDELEADYLGLQYVYKAGYNPSAYVALLARLAPKIAVSQIQHDSLRASPSVSERIAQAEKEIRKILPNAPQPRSSPEFVLMKSHL